MKTEHCEANQVGHSVHILENLEHAEGEAAETALRLHRDPELLRMLLWRIRIPKDVERAAISLAPEDEGPYLVVTSAKGDIDTYLERGMSIQGLYLVPYARMVPHLAMNTAWQERRDLARSLVGEDKDLGALLPLVITRGEGLSREQLIGLSVLQPALKEYLIKHLVRVIADVDKFGRTLVIRKRFDSTNKKHVRALNAYWSLFHSAGHLALLSAAEGSCGLEKLLQKHSSTIMGLFSELLVSGSPAMALRLAWFVGKVGSALFTDCRRMMFEPRLPQEWLLGLLGVTAVGLRHPKYRSHAVKAVESAFKTLNRLSPNVLKFVMKSVKSPESLYMQIMRALLSPEKTREIALDCAKKSFIVAYGHTALPSAYTFKSSDEVPSGLAMAHAANSSESFHREPKAAATLIAMMPWAAECEAEDFYFPEDFLRHIRQPWTFEKSIRLVDNEREGRGIQKTVTVPKTPGRNDPCPCGSGKKYKKCCIASH